MTSTVEDIEELIRQATLKGFRGRLLDRGSARSMIWVDGVLPEGAPNFADKLSYDLLSYGYALLSLGIQLRELNGNRDLCRTAFEKSAAAITDVIHNGSSDTEKGFHRVVAASAYHLGGFSAKAFSVIRDSIENKNVSRMEQALCLLILREFNELENLILKWKISGLGSDKVLAKKLESEIDQLNHASDVSEQFEDTRISSIELSVVDLAITDNYYSAIFEFLFALETGSPTLLDDATRRIDNSLSVSGELNMVPQWWILRITKHLLNDLWESSFHRIIPFTPDQELSQNWKWLRGVFIASLFKRNKAEIDLWPSQIEGARRAVEDFDDLVISLPTSSGKTRIAELCILRCLAIGKRVLFITPLRALSAQTETSLRKTFLPLGKSVSSLYGSMGISDFEQDVLKTKDIVVGTPEKLDFALRNDPSLIDDVGLVVLDEGHMIGLSEREISYEVQIQRLLKRADSNQRRIVCLSAILPDGDQFEDFVAWLRQDKEGSAIQSSWRPTDLKFGEIVWQNGVGQINFKIGKENPVIPGYIKSFVPPFPNPGKRKKPFPDNAQELTVATAWRLIEDNHTVLIYCPQKDSVNAFAMAIVDLHKRGALKSVLIDPSQIEFAKLLGTEWLGSNHPIVECLDMGVAIHHGALPTPFRKEIEKLLRKGVLKVTISSPTLAQGLNLAATVVIVHSLYRNGKLIEASEFKNVVGRAGRAFIDIQGLVLHPIFDKHARRKQEWRTLVGDVRARDMESGLVRLVFSLVDRITKNIGNSETNNILEYILNNTQPWNFPEMANEPTGLVADHLKIWRDHIVYLDKSLLSMLGEEDISINEIPNALDTILKSSLWERRLTRYGEERKTLYNSVLAQRAKYIWNVTTPRQRKGYFLAGVGLETGQRLDAISKQANTLLIQANAHIAFNNHEAAITSIIELAKLVFDIEPFIPNSLPNNWTKIMEVWLQGDLLTDHDSSNINETLKFIEDGLIYRLPWGLEAIRVRALANQDIITEDTKIDDYELRWVIPAIENGTLNKSAALLMQAGFNSRKAAIKAINTTNAIFENAYQLKEWLCSNEVIELTNHLDWPTPETALLWKEFIKGYHVTSEFVWRKVSQSMSVAWLSDYHPQPGSFVKILNYPDGDTQVIGSDGEKIGRLSVRLNLLKTGIYYSVISNNTDYLDISFLGEGTEPFKFSLY